MPRTRAPCPLPRALCTTPQCTAPTPPPCAVRKFIFAKQSKGPTPSVAFSWQAHQDSVLSFEVSPALSLGLLCSAVAYVRVQCAVGWAPLTAFPERGPSHAAP